ncbi:MAG TPA: hypothetical protein VGV39_26680 [Mesorhizobium sp.]|uniref:hypothetical protein n=1 Tax=Mesorhizobium sp. TaxID=1871066 RepID=UPI002DDD6198|nr:hypothetical protein [Mesorhizobium sp.]HEV2506688.1 hypothetical protein [Mesorhizobium sp.]
MTLISTKRRPFTLGIALAAAAMNTATPLIAPIFGPRLSMGTEAHASAPIEMNAATLLKDMRGSLAAMAFSFKDASADSRRRSGANVVAAVTETSKAMQNLEGALGSKNAASIAKGTKAVSRAVGDLQTRYALSATKNGAATKALQRFNVAWSAYSSRYVLSKPAKSIPKASRAEVHALKRKVSNLTARVRTLENQVADNAALRAEVRRMHREIAYLDGRFDDPVVYQRAAFMLVVFAGYFDAFVVTTRTYYPAYYVYFDNAYYISPRFDDYWDGYYDGYYDGLASSWYDDPIIISDPILEVSQPAIYQDVTYETIYNVTNETTNIYAALPEEDLSRVAVEPLPADVDFTVEKTVTNEAGALPESSDDHIDDANIDREQPQQPRQDDGEAIESGRQVPGAEPSVDLEMPADVDGTRPHDQVLPPTDEASPSQDETLPTDEDAPLQNGVLPRR